MRKVFVNVTVQLIINMDEGVTIGEIIQEMDYSFTANSDHPADIVDTEILEWDLTDSK